MNNRLILLFAVCIQTAFSQAPLAPLQAVKQSRPDVYTGDKCGTGCIDNRSQYSRKSNYHSYQATGTGTWSVDLQFADTNPTGWVSFGSTGQVSQASGSGIGYGIGYHDYIRFVVTGTATVSSYFGTRDAYWSPSVASISFPLAINQGGCNATTDYGCVRNLGYLVNYTGAVDRTVQSKLGDVISVADFGCKGDNSTDDTGCFNLALAYAATKGTGATITGAGVTLTGGSQVYVPAPSVAYKIAGTISFPGTAFGMGLIGDGANNTWLNCTGGGDCIYVPHLFSNNASVTFEKFTVNCPGSCGANAVAIHLVDVVGSRWKDVHMQNFTGASGTCGLLQNTAYWTERNFLRAVSTSNCKVGIRFLKDAGDSYNSFGYNELDVQQNVNDGQTGFSVEGGAYVYNGKYRFTANLNQSAATTTYIAVTGSSTFSPYGGENACEFTGEGNSGTPQEFNVATGNVFGCTGFVSTGMRPGTITGVNSSLPNVANLNRVETTHNLGAAGAAPGGIGTWIIPSFGSYNGSCSGIGYNVYFDGFGASPSHNYIVQGDGANNGGTLILSCYGSPALSYYIFPSTGGGNQSIAVASLGSYFVASVTGTGGNGVLTASSLAANTVKLTGGTSNLNLQADPLGTGSYIYAANNGNTIQPLHLTGSPLTIGPTNGSYNITSESTGGIKLLGTLGQPTCVAGIRGTFWYGAGNSGFKDFAQVCAKDAADAYAWRTIY
jgi:hypothetical protein